MRLLIAAVGKLKHGPERELFAHYLDRAEAIGRKTGLSPLSAIEVAEAKAATAEAPMASIWQLSSRPTGSCRSAPSPCRTDSPASCSPSRSTVPGPFSPATP